MKLEKLVIKGFKSFANETVINFDEDVIGIVGPNGSGKSNIVDAVRWVLGEQKSRELRLEKMNNVIFNGTKKKRPGGMAQVSLIFQNDKKQLATDFASVEITRILYRSGDSEYRLNGVTCRLKDITNLFIDTGIGSNSYAIIALGMVDDILQDKDNARRMMFEQAAGISKYKKSKQDTLRQLKLAENDLTRVEDLLYEYEHNLKTLEKQAKRTKKYFEIKEAYKTASIELANYQTFDLKEKFKTLKAQIESETIKYQGFDASILKKEAALAKQKKENLDFEKNLSEKQKVLNEMVARIRSLENEKKLMAQRIKFAESSRQKNQQQLELLNTECVQYENQIQVVEKQYETAAQDLQSKQEAVDEAAKKMKALEAEHAEFKSGVEVILKKQQRAEKEIFELEKEQAVFQNQKATLLKTISDSQLKEQEHQKQFSFVQTEFEDITEKEAKQKAYVAKLEKDEEGRQESIQNLQEKLEFTRNELAKVNRSLDSRQNEYDLTKSLVENLEGFPESIKYLSKNWKSQAVLLSDLLFCPEEYRTALETFLEPYLSYYVVADKKEAQEAIQLLGRSQKGRANFFLLNAFEKQPESKPTENTEGVYALDIVEVEPRYERLMQYLLSGVYIAEEEVETTGNVVFLKKDGSLIQSKRHLTGGSVGLFEGKFIGRKKNLEKLEAIIKTLKTDRKELKIQLDNEQSKLEALKKNELDKVLRKETHALSELTNQRIGLSTKLENFNLMLETLGADRQEAQQKIDTLEQEILEIKGELRIKQDDLAGLKAKINSNDSGLKELSDALSQATQTHNSCTISFLQQQNAVQSIKQDLSFKKQNWEQALKQIKKLQQELEQSDSEIKKASELERTASEELKKCYEEKESSVQDLNDVEHTYYQKRNAINELEDEMQQLNRNRQQVQVLINELKDSFSEVRLQITSISERLRAEFNISINDMVNEAPDADFNAAQTEATVEKLKGRLQNYGEINPMAVEAYDEMLGRYNDIVKQRDDILEAKTSLLATIDEIETTATEQFNEAFKQVRENFIRVFRSLFTADDTCDLLLLDPENPLESRIEIVAKPKGKRPISISQLSGGEKTLTATALLFSLYLLKPAPFCIFDEVDAPLDDANIDKFNNIIRDFSKESQFIIVTHNKQTMAAVDTIYGVHSTDGISGVLPVDYRAYRHEPQMEKVKIN